MATTLQVPQNNVMESFAQGSAAADASRVNASNLLDAQRKRSMEDLQRIASVGLGAMNGDINGRVDEAKWAQLVPWAKSQGIDISSITPDMVPTIVRSSMSAMQQVQTAQSEQELQMATTKLQAELAQLAAKPAVPPTDDMREYNLYVEQAKAAGQQPLPFMEYQTQLRKSSATTIDFNANQGNAAGFADRMVNANTILSDPNMVKAMTDLGQLATKAAVPFGLGNYMVSSEFQQADQAMRDFITAILRKESGAVISQDEFATARQQYFPQPGDSEQVIAQKARNRQIAIEGVTRSAGTNYQPPSLTPGGGGDFVPAEDYFK